MSENIKEIKKRITEEWLNTVPQLSPFAQNKLFRIVGCTIIGIELINIPNIEGYKPHFVVYPLWKENAKICLDVPSIYFGIENKKGLQFSIPYLKHNNYFNEAIECLKKQLPILWDENIALKSLYDLVDTRFNDVLIKSNSAQQVKLFELKFYTALYTRNQFQIQNILNQIQQASKNWNMQIFEMWYGKFDTWLHGLQEKASRREEILKQIKVNKRDKKISQLKGSEFTV